MLSANKLKYYSSLKIKKYRKQEGKFIVEGLRLVNELIKSGYPAEIVFYTEDFADSHKEFVRQIENAGYVCEIVSNKEIKKLSDTENPQGIVAIALIPKAQESTVLNAGLVVAIDNIAEPGNLGTILRTCDWFGIKNVLLSRDTVDPFNPKTVRASMGAIFYLNLLTVELPDYLSTLRKEDWKIMTTDLSGEDIFSLLSYPDKTIVVFSNEANGTSEEIKNISDATFTVPKYGNVESLNVSAAAAVMLAELKNRGR